MFSQRIGMVIMLVLLAFVIGNTDSLAKFWAEFYPQKQETVIEKPLTTPYQSSSIGVVGAEYDLPKSATTSIGYKLNYGGGMGVKFSRKKMSTSEEDKKALETTLKNIKTSQQQIEDLEKELKLLRIKYEYLR